MRRFSSTILVAIVVAAGLVAVGSIRGTADEPAAVVRWEYKTVSTTAGTTLNELGREGWELVATSPGSNSSSLLYFKRSVK